MIYLHPGLGKTGTTWLQTSVFPELLRQGYLDSFNQEETVKHSLECAFGGEPSSGRYDFNHSGTHLISREELAGCNPAIWKARADNLLRCFGPDTLVILTLRHPREYLRSVYQQMVAQGVLLRPDAFFVKNESSTNARAATRWTLTETFEIDEFLYERLIDLYQERFSRVLVIPFEDVKDLSFLRRLDFWHSDKFDDSLMAQSKSPSNRAYSAIGMRLTFARERLIRFFGMRSINSCDRYLLNNYALIPDFTRRFNELSRYEKIQQLPTKFASKYLTWRGFIQNIFDKVVPYKKWDFPDGQYLGRHYERNLHFYNTLREGSEL